MCVWSAYAGNRQAAPILWNSLSKIEGIWGGYYTGLLTLDKQNFNLKKCVGHTGVWKQNFNLNDFTGNAGLIHSRTNSGGDGKFAHPFMGCHGKVAAVAQGCMGNYAQYTEKFGEAGSRMLKQGRTFPGATWSEKKIYKFTLDDGSQVPMSEVVTSLIEQYYEETGDPIAAMRKTALELPEESATIVLFADRPGEIGVINVNQHVVCFRTNQEVMLSVTALGLPGLGMEIPGNTVGLVSPQTCHLEKISDFFDINPIIPAYSMNYAIQYLRQNPGVLAGNLVDKCLSSHFPQTDKLLYKAVAGYQVVEAMAKAGKIRFEPTEVTGGTGAPGRIFKIFLQE